MLSRAKVLLVPFLTTLLVISVPGIRSSQASCVANPVARIQSGNSDNYETNAVICSGVEIVNPQDVVLHCYLSQTEVRLPDRSTIVDRNTCAQGVVTQRSEASTCDPSSPGDRVCSNPKGPETASQFQILEPDETSGERPSISWESVSNAQSYTVYVAGPGANWRRTVNAETTALTYPDDEPSLTVGTAYEITIAAYVSDQQARLLARNIVNVDESVVQHIDIQLAARMKDAQ